MEAINQYTKTIKRNETYLELLKNNGNNILWIASWMFLQLLIQLPSRTEKKLEKKKNNIETNRTNETT